MKFTPRTIQILRNYATINPSLLFREGSLLETMSPTKTVIATAELDVAIDNEFAIYNLSQFLSAVSLFNEPEISYDMDTKALTITGPDGDKMKYTCAEPSLIAGVSLKNRKLPSVDVEVTLPDSVLQRTLKALSIIESPELAFTGDGEIVWLEAIDSRKPGNSTYRTPIGQSSDTFRMIFKEENIRMLPGDYIVQICAKGIASFEGAGVKYWVAVEAHSTFRKG